MANIERTVTTDQTSLFDLGPVEAVNAHLAAQTEAARQAGLAAQPAVRRVQAAPVSAPAAEAPRQEVGMAYPEAARGRMRFRGPTAGDPTTQPVTAGATFAAPRVGPALTAPASNRSTSAHVPFAPLPSERAAHTADRGHGAPALHVARQAVRQETVQHGVDRDNPFVQRRFQQDERTRTERSARGAGHPDIFDTGPARRTPTAEEEASRKPGAAFAREWRNFVDKAHDSYEGVSAQAMKRFAQAYAVEIHRTELAADDALRVATGATTRYKVAVERGHARYEATDLDLRSALDTLADNARHERSVGLPQHERRAGMRRAPSALEQAREQLEAKHAPALHAAKEAQRYFGARVRDFIARRALGREFALTDRDFTMAATLGLATPSEAGKQLVTAQVFFDTVMPHLAVANDEAWLGVTKDAIGAEQMQRVTDEVQYREQRANDRYTGTRERESDAKAARSADQRRTTASPTKGTTI